MTFQTRLLCDWTAHAAGSLCCETALHNTFEVNRLVAQQLLLPEKQYNANNTLSAMMPHAAGSAGTAMIAALLSFNNV
jgi:hypothetical protein